MALSPAELSMSGTALARPEATVNYRSVLSSEKALQNNKAATVQRKFQWEKKKSAAGPRWVPDTKTDWPTDYRS
jgi:hypothetical protein